ncbi:MAG: hypothetical protein M1832_000923 [Thelocarpon impressellum]|nr:MAG: hypothetical protein M1832_000923 [Thelocarpon impressellum]
MGPRNRARKDNGRPAPSREVTVSKAISWILRHGAAKEGLALDEGGYARVDDLLAWHKLRALGVSFAELQELVRTNEKQRFALIPAPKPSPSPSTSPSPASFLIRANQGHSLPDISAAALLTPITPATLPAAAIHGTYRAAWPKIFASGGLSRMGRAHIHFASALPASSSPLTPYTDRPSPPAETEAEVRQEGAISGIRPSATVLVYVDVARSMVEGGVAWWRSANGVVLTAGVGDTGVLPLRFVERVVERRTGEVLYAGGGEGEGEGREAPTASC